MELCGKKVISRTAYSKHFDHKCQLPTGHTGKCKEFPFLDHLSGVEKKVAAKIKRDSTMTTGASWGSEDAGPNRMPRYVAILNDEDLKDKFGLDLSGLSDVVKAKIREKAADYDSCIDVARKLTWLAYQMLDAPNPDVWAKNYLESFFGEMRAGSTVCEVCRLPLSFTLFAEARVGKAELETAHKTPRVHNADNVGFAHRYCNVAQGNKSIDQFYDWMRSVLHRVELGAK